MSAPPAQSATASAQATWADVNRDVPKLLDLYGKGELKLDELISRRIDLEDVNGAFEAMTSGEVARSVITYGTD